MGTKNEVTHTGVVKSIQGGGIHVSIVVMAGCSGCNIKSSCSMSDQTQKEIEIMCDPTPYQVGQHVEIRLKESLGFHALFLGYLLPFLVLLTAMIIASYVTNNEGIIGLVAIGSLAPYYLLLFLYKNRIKKKFTYTVQPLN